MEQQNNPASIEELFLIAKNHYDFFNHVMTMLMKSRINKTPIADRDFKICEDWLGLIADEYLTISDRFYTNIDNKKRRD